MAETRITVRPNGPYLVQGDFEVREAAGNRLPVQGGVAALCRCGASAKKPFCDASHARIGFDAPSPAR